MLSFTTWNVNSIRARMHIAVSFLEEEEIDVAFFQETKVADEKFPEEPFLKLGYRVIKKGQPQYNGVAVLTRFGGEKTTLDFEDPLGQKRLLAVEFGSFIGVNVYVPRGGYPGEEAFNYKMEFLRRLDRAVRKELERGRSLLVAGDLNIAPEEIDVFDPGVMRGEVCFLDEEREAFRGLIDAGLRDLFWKFNSGKEFTWWDYRMGAFRRNLGLRIDHILVSEELYNRAISCSVDRKYRGAVRPSDHAPLRALFEV
ncbi:MAG: exodeoxyribonuclease III [Candidatus Hydrothermae bacterium]|nr:exodeoxyribonuclease III [Candidatus Hydrothermae bacterium]